MTTSFHVIAPVISVAIAAAIAYRMGRKDLVRRQAWWWSLPELPRPEAPADQPSTTIE